MVLQRRSVGRLLVCTRYSLAQSRYGVSMTIAAHERNDQSHTFTVIVK